MSAFIPPSISSIHWEKVGVKQHHGINIFLPSLKRRNSPQGDLLSLKMLLPWLKKTGFNVIQLLPINDSGDDISPYNIISAHALNPSLLPPESLKPLNKKDPDFQAFQKKSTYWLKPYCLFKTLKEKNGNKAFWDWSKKEQSYNNFLYTQHQEKAIAYAHTQYLLHKEMRALQEEASSLDILLMGDLPILISPDSVEAWLYPALFDKNYCAGAPPDYYAKEGQCWGFPLHRFDTMQKDNFTWWKERLRTASAYYNLYRIDHAVGLFRLWAIAKGKKATEGFFIPEKRSIWLQQGRIFLKALLEGSSLLPIAEDLGVIPPEVRSTLIEDGIPGTKVPRWERYWDAGGGFIPLKDYPVCSLTTVSTHDSQTLKEWWFEQNNKTLDQATLFKILRESHQSSSLFHINLLGEYLALFKELVYNDDKLERINIPGHINNTNWCYRTKPFLEELIEHKELLHMMQKMI